MAAHEASSLYRYMFTTRRRFTSLHDIIVWIFSPSEEKAKLLRDVMAKIESKNETLE